MSALSPTHEVWAALDPAEAAAWRATILAAGHPPAVAERALQLLDQVSGRPHRCSDSDVQGGMWLETHTLGCRDAADEPEAQWWDSHFEIWEKYRTDGCSLVLGDPTDGVFLTITPQVETTMAVLDARP